MADFGSSGTESIGIYLNQWLFPVNEFSCFEEGFQSTLKSLEYVGEFNFSSEEWNNVTTLVDEYLNALLSETNKHAFEFDGLIFEAFRKQDSAREGLKIRAADEFDVLLEYRIQGLRLGAEPIWKNNKPIPGLGKMKILNPVHEVENHYARLLQKKIIVKNTGSYFLNSRILHQAVLDSVLNKCISGSDSDRVSAEIFQSTNPPSINLMIKITQKTGRLWEFTDIHEGINIHIGVVPAMIINLEEAMGASGFMECPRYAVGKWMEQSQASDFKDPEMIWCFSTSGYETHYMDVFRYNKEKCYIMTACRIIKAFMGKEKDKSPIEQHPLHISTFLSSFYLKNIALYCMLFVTSVRGVHEALGYFLGFLNVSLGKGSLPHFFHGNYLLKEYFPSCAVGGRINLFEHASPDTLSNVRINFGIVLSRLSGMYDSRAFESDACARFQEYLTR